MLKFAKPKESKNKDIEKRELKNWKILVVDDEKEVHVTTKSVLKKFVYEDRKLDIFHAYSGKEALEILKQEQDIALILLDVVMESDDAGLKVAKAIREELNNQNVRIVLRTGEPGQVPEKEVIKAYDINDYKEKTELTSTKLYTTIISSLRTYRDIVTIQQSRVGLKKIIEASKSLFSERSLILFTEGVLTQLISILQISIQNDLNKKGAYFAVLEQGEFKVLSTKEESSKDIISEDATYLMYEAYEAKESFFKDDIYIGFYQSEDEKTIFLYLEGCGKLNEIDRELLKIFSQNISVAFNNLCLHDELIDTQSEIVKKLGEVIESRSKETANHVERVARTSYILAKAYGLSEEEATKIRLASPMHDIGKVAIPDEILLKPGKLTDEEFEKMKEHSLIGWEILKDSNREILRTSALIARDHHEKWDGSGYPYGLKGEEISLYGRITAVADVFDAVRHKRVYKDAWPLDKVIDFFKSQRGKHFEPKLVDLLLENLDEIVDSKDVNEVKVGGNEFIKNMNLTINDLSEQNLSKLLFEDDTTVMVVGFISPHIDFKSVSTKIKEFFGDEIKVLLTSTAGELCNIEPNSGLSIYLEANENWDSIVLQSFSNKIVDSVSIYTIPLKNEDILADDIVKTTQERVKEIQEEIEKIEIDEEIDYKRDFALTFIDGVSKSESFFMEALYKSGKFPCNVIGGSVGGKLDFKETFIFDNRDVVTNHAVVALIKSSEDVRFGILKSQNYIKTNHSFLVVEADPIKRWVKTIKRKCSDRPENIIDYLCEIFKCTPDRLEKKFTRFSLGFEINGELYIRSVASVDLENRKLNFYVDVDFGDELFLCKMTDFKKQTKEDFEEFLAQKDGLKPIAGLMNDCVLRRIINDKNISKLRVFDEVLFIGFSTFGEILGVNINQALAAVFFFKVDKDSRFKDHYIDDFIVQYSNYQSFFRERELKRLKSNELKDSYQALATLNRELKEKYEELEKSKKRLVESEKMASLGGMVAGVAHEINTPVGMALTGISHFDEELKSLSRLYKEDSITEDDFIEFLESGKVLSKSIQNNLNRAANLVKSFKQVAVDQSSDEDRDFYLKEYIDEVLISIDNKIKKTKHKIVVDIDKNIKLNSNPGIFSQILTNFIMNSFIHAFEDIDSGKIKISAKVIDKDLEFIYQDNGKGLNQEQKEKIFEPFFTTNRANGGSGLGMNIVYNLITSKLNGEIKVKSKEGDGVKFIINLKNIVV